MGNFTKCVIHSLCLCMHTYMSYMICHIYVHIEVLIEMPLSESFRVDCVRVQICMCMI